MEPKGYSQLRKKIGTQKAVAEMLGVARSVIAKRETGKAGISIEAEIAINHLGGVDSPETQDFPIQEIADAVAERLKGSNGAVLRGKPSPEVEEGDDWDMIGFPDDDKRPTTYKEVKLAAKELMIKHPAGSEQIDRIGGALERIYKKHFAADDNET